MFEENIFGLVPKKDLLDIGYDVTRPNEPADQLFGDIKTDNLLAYWETMSSEYNLPVMAQYHAFDTVTRKTIRRPIDTKNIEKGLIKVKIPTTERLQQLLDRGVVAQTALEKRVLDDGFTVSEEVFTRSKVAKNEVLATGKMTIKENNLDITIDYGVPQDNVNLTLDFGAGAEKPLFEQMEDLLAAAVAKGVTLNGIYTSKAMLSAMRKDSSFQKAVNGYVMDGQILRESAFKAFLNEELGINRVITNDYQYSLPLTEGSDGRPVTSARRFYPVDKITFFAGDGKIGDGLWGDPPTVRANNFMAGATDAAASNVSPYVYVSQYVEDDPVIVWTKAEGLFVPALFNPTALFIATKTATPLNA